MQIANGRIGAAVATTADAHTTTAAAGIEAWVGVSKIEI